MVIVRLSQVSKNSRQAARGMWNVTKNGIIADHMRHCCQDWFFGAAMGLDAADHWEDQKYFFRLEKFARRINEHRRETA